MPTPLDVVALGNAIVDVIAPATDEFLQSEGLAKGSMMLIDDERAHQLYAHMAAGLEASGGSAGNTVAGVASLGGRAGYIGKVADDQLGEVYRHDITAIGVKFEAKPLTSGPATGRSLINVTPDGQRTMCTYLGAANQLMPDDVSEELVQGASIVYLEGYLFDPPQARQAFAKAARIARTAGRRIAITLSDAFVVERHRSELLAFIDSDVDLVFANAAEVASLFQTDDFETAARELGARTQIAAVTHGAQGSVVIAGDLVERIPAAPAPEVVDTTGAGDQYAAGFLFGLARDLPLVVCGRLGSLAAAEVIGHYGPRPQTPLQVLAKDARLI